MAAFSLPSFDQHLLPCFSAFDALVIDYESEKKADFSNDGTFVSSKRGDDSFSTVVGSAYRVGVRGRKGKKMEKKRIINGSSLISSSQSKDGNEVKNKRQKKITVVKIEEKEKKVKKFNGIKEKKKNNEEIAPIEYIHVRARRGQATDSHSLAERVRRKKLSERMKILQGLVPGCDKITGKILMLDEIINYVQSLQNQAEFLSTKLASIDPMLFEFGMETDNFILTPEVGILDAEPIPISTPADIYPLLDHSRSDVLFDAQMQTPNILTQFQDNGQTLWDIMLDDPRQKVNNELGFVTNNLCSFDQINVMPKLPLPY